jgi:hypothetical protein
MVFVIEKACVLVATLLSFKLGVCHPYGLVCGRACDLLVYLYPFALLLDFLYIHLSQLSFTYYTSLYLLDYAYHCARVSRNEMQNSFVRPCYITYHDCNIERAKT